MVIKALNQLLNLLACPEIVFLLAWCSFWTLVFWLILG